MVDLKQEYAGRKVLVTIRNRKAEAVIHYCDNYKFFFFCGDDSVLNGGNDDQAKARATKYAWCVRRGTVKQLKYDAVTDWEFENKIIEVW